MPNLRDQLSSLATDFASAVLDAIRGASLEDLLAESSAAPRRGPGRPRGGTNARPTAAPAVAATSKGRVKGGRLPRRSPVEIEKTLGTVVSALKATKGKGMRSEEIQKALKLDKRELPRVLRTGLAKKSLKSKGQKRATLYFAA